MMDLKDYGITMWEEEKIASFREKLLAWYDANKRDLPWRRTQDPYKIWISEIMLQQTRVDTVIPYYERFLDWFPTLADLAQAPEEKLLKAWEGLGYYSRVRNMQKAAQQIMEDHGGVFPATYEAISKLKGIGPYTAGAIASIAFGLPEPAVDGNVMRVLARLFEVDYDIGVPTNRKIFQAMMEVLIDPERPGDFNQALMDLGSDIESPVNPRPEESPVKEFSAAYQHGTMDRYPIKAPKKKPVPVYLTAFIIKDSQGRYLLEKNEREGLLSGFWHFPLIEVDSLSENLGQLSLLDEKEQAEGNLEILSFEQDYDLVIDWQERTYPLVQHVFSHRKWQVQIRYGLVKEGEQATSESTIWLQPEKFSAYPFAKPQQKIWTTFTENEK
ncbi:A/G-specific adenine glycosylase [Streptococcus xiaochunlingii]|uniref:A/G-specific adenine glycosylase n=1 Tax=Streptococcus xiaochunlingii TaxID=2589788 RepID=UPI002554EB1E|nr:A/G-specific adenine glycosylase [Streptococcus xiaochunlingii]MDK8385840.1 A/G-specific adenine glycosylase [Streptococcus xiaochunlingii]MDK8778408.1 A/G-specific adenine glycosylase [Streptococcus xiaochunlingii]